MEELEEYLREVQNEAMSTEDMAALGSMVIEGSASEEEALGELLRLKYVGNGREGRGGAVGGCGGAGIEVLSSCLSIVWCGRAKTGHLGNYSCLDYTHMEDPSGTHRPSSVHIQASTGPLDTCTYTHIHMYMYMIHSHIYVHMYI